jgi:hypothetical protein
MRNSNIKDLAQVLHVVEMVRSALHDLLRLPIKETEGFSRKLRSHPDWPQKLVTDMLDVDRKTVNSYRNLPDVFDALVDLLTKHQVSTPDTRIFEIAQKPVTYDRILTELRSDKLVVNGDDVKKIDTIIETLCRNGSLTKSGNESRAVYCSSDQLIQVEDNSPQGILARRARCLAILLGAVPSKGGILTADLTLEGADQVRTYLNPINVSRAARRLTDSFRDLQASDNKVNTGILSSFSKSSGHGDAISHAATVLLSPLDTAIMHVPTRENIADGRVQEFCDTSQSVLLEELGKVMAAASSLPGEERATYTLSFAIGRFRTGVAHALGNL